MIVTVLQSITLVLLTLNMNDGCSVLNMGPYLAEKEIEYHSIINGRVDFVGFEIDNTLDHLLLYSELYKGQDRSILSLFISKLDEPLRDKVRVVRSYDFSKVMELGLPHNALRGGYHDQILSLYHHPIDDEPNCLSCIFNFKPYMNRNDSTRMEKIALSQIKKYSDADYFLLTAIHCREFNTKENNKIKPVKPEDNEAQDETWIDMPSRFYFDYKVAVALLTVVYNRNGKKVYSKVYTEKLEAVSYETNLLGRKNIPLSDCIMKLIENQGGQINKDLSFLLGADNAPAPTLEDLHQRLQQPGTIQEDVKWLKTFPNQKKRRR